LEEVTVCTGYEVFMEVDDNILLIVGDPCEILDHTLRPHPIQLLNIIIISIILKYILLDYLIKQTLRTVQTEGEHKNKDK
jgi:hypothetical protein